MGSSCCLIRPRSSQDTDITQTSVFIKHSSSLVKIRKRITIEDEEPHETMPSISFMAGWEDYIKENETVGYQSVLDLFDRYESESTGEDWKHESLSVQHIQAWCNYKGSHLNKDYP